MTAEKKIEEIREVLDRYKKRGQAAVERYLSLRKHGESEREASSYLENRRQSNTSDLVEAIEKIIS